MDDVYIVEIASTGNDGMPKDTVAEGAVCRMFSDGSDFETVYYGRIALDPRDLGKEGLDHLATVYGIEPEGLYMGDPEEIVVTVTGCRLRQGMHIVRREPHFRKVPLFRTLGHHR